MPNDTLVFAANQALKQSAKVAGPKVAVAAASGSAATEILPTGTISWNSLSYLMPRLPSLPSVTTAPKFLKALLDTNYTALLQSGTEALTNAKDSSIKALGDALSAAVPDVIENAAKAHPAVAGFVAGAALVGTVAYRKEIKDGAKSGLSSAATKTTDLFAKGVAKAKELRYGKPVVARAEEPKPAPAVVATTVRVDLSPATAASKAASPKQAPAQASTATWGFSLWKKAATATTVAESPKLTAPDLAKALAATNAAAKEPLEAEAAQAGHGKVSRKRVRAGGA